MKIYCNRRQHNVDDFIGKDIWVKVLQYPSLDSELCEYVRVLDVISGVHFADGKDRYEVNAIDSDYAEGVTRYDDELVGEDAIACELLQRSFRDDLVLVEPLQAMSSSELLNNLLYYRKEHIGFNEMDNYDDEEDD